LQLEWRLAPQAWGERERRSASSKVDQIDSRRAIFPKDYVTGLIVHGFAGWVYLAPRLNTHRAASEFAVRV
jgi:hypothetical protein